MLHIPFNQFSPEGLAQDKTQGVCFGVSIYVAAHFQVEGSFLGYTPERLKTFDKTQGNRLIDWDQMGSLQNKTAYWLQSAGHLERTVAGRNQGWFIYKNPEAPNTDPMSGHNSARVSPYAYNSILNTLHRKLYDANSSTTLIVYPRTTAKSFTQHTLSVLRQGERYCLIDVNHGLYFLASKEAFDRFMLTFLKQKYPADHWKYFRLIDFECSFKAKLSYWDRLRSSFLFYLRFLVISIITMLALTLILPFIFHATPFLITAWCIVGFCMAESLCNIVTGLMNALTPRCKVPPVNRVLPQRQADFPLTPKQQTRTFDRGETQSQGTIEQPVQEQLHTLQRESPLHFSKPCSIR